jgi:hypothetical protein
MKFIKQIVETFLWGKLEIVDLGQKSAAMCEGISKNCEVLLYTGLVWLSVYRGYCCV